MIPLEERVNKMKGYIVSYIIVALWDYYLTVCGTILGVSKEVNPIANYLINAYGLFIGLAIHKFLFTSLVILGTLALYKRNEMYCKLIYIAMLLTLVGSSTWLLV